LTEEALQHPVFQVSESGSTADLWSHLPTFTQYGKIDAAKSGAQTWAVHQTDEGPQGRRILMASQRFGAGLSGVLCIQNFWRWRLAKEADPQQFDRFWRQLFRFLGEAGRQEIAITSRSELRPQSDIALILEKQPNPKVMKSGPAKFKLRVEDSQKNMVREESAALEPLHPVEVKFHAKQSRFFYRNRVRLAQRAGRQPHDRNPRHQCRVSEYRPRHGDLAPMGLCDGRPRRQSGGLRRRQRFSEADQKKN
jgi:hypothetical protein